MSVSKDIDVITVGRSSIDLYGAEFGVDLSDVSLFRNSVGGSPTNIAIGASRLGLRAALLTRVGVDQMGTTILQTLEREGVDVSAIQRDAERLTALVLLAVKDRTNAPHIFYRHECADMALSEADVDPALVARAKSIVVTGTHFSTETVANASWKAIRLAKENGAKVIFDIDFRPSLWGLAAHADGAERSALAPRVSEAFSAVINAADVVVGTEEEICAACNLSDVEAALHQIRSEAAVLIVCKRGAYGCDIFPGGATGKLEAPLQGTRFNVDVVNSVGAGDAFMAGFLRAYLKGEDLQSCATFANACGAIAVTRLLCSQDYATWPELQYFIEHAREGQSTSDIPDTLRYTSMRKKPEDNLFVLACDHRSQFRDIADSVGSDYSRMPVFKRLAVAAAAKVNESGVNVGVIIDEEYGADALFDATREELWSARPIEIPGSRPIRFVDGPDIGSALITWPQSQTVKCLCHYDPDDETALLEEQNESLRRVYQACRRTGHEFLLEIIVPSHVQHERGEALSRAMRQIYALGVKPDWWKLEPFSDAAAWYRASEIIHENGPGCRGIVVLGQTSSDAQLADAFQASNGADMVKGFAIGRAIVGATFKSWLTGEIDDAGAVEQMQQKFRHFIQIWQDSRVPITDSA